MSNIQDSNMKRIVLICLLTVLTTSLQAQEQETLFSSPVDHGGFGGPVLKVSQIAGFAPLSLQASKRVLNDDGAYEEQWPTHKELFDRAWGSQDVIEAQVARIEKRAPRFQGA